MNSPAFEHDAISAPGTRRTDDDRSVLELVNPADETVIAETALASADDVDRAVRAAEAALPTWRAAMPHERASVLLALADELERHSEELVGLESLTVGKPISAAREEVPVVIDVLRFYAGAARVSHTAAAGEYSPGSTSYVRREPVGVVGLIAPWNYPLLEAVWKIAPALAAGNTMVLKPSELTPLTTIRLEQLAQRVLPAGVLNVVVGDGRTGEALVSHPAVAMVSLTGVTSAPGLRSRPLRHRGSSGCILSWVERRPSLSATTLTPQRWHRI
ncbi:aldehyde dehydrogenase family protein [Saccharopolyspora pogona]|uniref:aldehyde dehydrogenase family protein n=1 Tax=Saccharopolyspora pogona TaxID=333966 RepID=UPI0021E08812|nr:aldehyde dehydrogenase family protein [Saccharopolyspora pogona]